MFPVICVIVLRYQTASGLCAGANYYVAAKATYIRLLLWQNGGFSALRKKGSDPYSAWMKYVGCVNLYIP